MSPLFFSLLLGVLTFILLINVFSVRIPRSPLLEKRLDNIKNRNTYKTSSSERDEEFAFLYNNFRYKFFAKYFSELRIIDYIKNQIAYSGVTMEVDTFLILSAMCCVPFLGIILTTSPKLFPLSLIGFLVPLGILKQKAAVRFNDFAKQLPDTLDLLAGSLRAGHSIYSAFEVITKEMPMPISGVFKSALDELTVGSDAKSAIISLAKTIPDNIDLRFFITSVVLQREVGGNLAKILDGLSVTIRERFKIAGQLKAQTAQARFSGFMLVCVPPAIASILFILSPDYMQPLLNTQQGNLALLLSVVLLLLGVWTINKIIMIEF